MTDDKYYTPQLEEFHVGFEYEIYEDFDCSPEKSWHPQEYGIHGANPENMGYVNYSTCQNKEVRVRLLSREDVIELGWGFKEKINKNWKSETFSIFNGYSGYHLIIHYHSVAQKEGLYISDDIVLDVVEIRSFHPDDSKGETIFYGTIKNKSELKKLMSQLSINGNKL